MGSIAFDSSGATDAPRSPISLHPAFPAVVALWFAALLGLGSMVLPVVLIERVVAITGISSLVPAASPPLGFMARGLIALVSAAAGAAIGVAIARRVARGHDASRPTRVAKFAKGVRRPIDVNEEIGGEGLVNGFGLPVNRRRALAIAEDDRPSDFLYMAPLPGHDEDETALGFDEGVPAPRHADEPFELSDAFEDSIAAAEGDASDPQADPEEDTPTTFEQQFQPPSPELRDEATQGFTSMPAEAKPEPLPFSAPSLARRTPETEAFEPEPEPMPAAPRAYEPPPIEPEPEEPEPQPFRGDWSSAPLGELGLVQLVQRLAASIERRREWLATVTAAPATGALPTPPAGFDPAPAEEAAQAMAAYFGMPAGAAPASVAEDLDDADDEPQLASFAPVGLSTRLNLLGSWPVIDDEDDADAMPSFTLPLRKAVAPAIGFDQPEAPENDDEIDSAVTEESDDSYCSLLAMRNPFTQKDNGFVRIEEPEVDDDAAEPTVVFPGHGESAYAPPSASHGASRVFDPPAGSGTVPVSHAVPAEADAALRAALATLQRMSGTA